MTHWLPLTNGVVVNLQLIEAVVRQEDGSCRFYPPRTQRGGRPRGKPALHPPGYREDDNCWEGVPADPSLLDRLLANTAASSLQPREQAT